MQTNLFDDQPEKIVSSIEDGVLEYYPHYFDTSTANNFLQRLSNDVEWKQEKMSMYGKEVNFPRLTAWYGNQDKAYTFSGITLQPKMWTKDLLSIKEKVETAADDTFNSVLLNLYRDGNDSISWHTDAEKELGENPTIASVNFGAERKFQLRHMEDHKKRHELLLEHGSLLIMKGALQHFWQHQVPKTKKQVSLRINLTFRKIF